MIALLKNFHSSPTSTLSRLLKIYQENRLIWYLAFITISIGIFSRFSFLGQIPTVFSHDEMGYIINAQSVALTGLGRYGDWSPTSLTPVEPTLAELPTLLIAPFLYLPFSKEINVRLPFVIMSLTLPLIIGWLATTITKSKKIGWFSAGLALVNPWIWQNGRMAFDIPISLWFYSLGTVIYLSQRGAKKLLALPIFFLGFYCYQGYKPLLPLVAIALGLFDLWQTGLINSKNLNPLRTKFLPNLGLIIFGIGLFSFYFFFQFSRQLNSQDKLSAQLLTPNSQIVTNAVNIDRRLALTTPFNAIFLNKYSQFTKEATGKFLQVLGWRELFFEISASSSSFSVWNHGMFYILDIILILIGGYALVKNRQSAILSFILIMMAIGTVPSVINQNAWLFFRSSFMFPFLIILAGAGLNEIFSTHKLIFKLVVFGYLIQVINFGFIYFVRYPVFGSENIYFSPRLVAEYLNRTAPNQKVVIFETEPEFAFRSYIFYNNLFSHLNAQEIQRKFKTQNYNFGQIEFLNCLPSDFSPQPKTTYIFSTEIGYCPNQMNLKLDLASQFKPGDLPIYIKSIKDSGTNYKIYSDTVCQDQSNLATFINPNSLRDFNFNQLSNQEFCQTWLAKDLSL